MKEFDSNYHKVYCEIHKKTIIIFKKDEALKGFNCWDCIRAKNYAIKS